MYRVLICEDDHNKFEAIKDSLVLLFMERGKNIKVERVTNIKDCFVALKRGYEEGVFDLFICDMQLPFHNDSAILLDGGTQILERVKLYDFKDMKTVVCSSSNGTLKVLKERKLDFPFLDFGSFEFVSDLRDYLKENFGEKDE